MAAGITCAAGSQLDGDNNGSPGGDCVIRGDQAPLLLMLTYAGDAKVDGVVGPTDLSALAAHWGQAGVWRDGDFSGDGTIGPADLSALAANWGRSVPPVLTLLQSQRTRPSAARTPDSIAVELFEPDANLGQTPALTIPDGGDGRVSCRESPDVA